MNPENRIAEEFKQIVLRRISDGKLILPVLPAVAAKCQLLSQRTELNTREVVSVLEQDPLVAAQLLQVANSSTILGRSGVRSIEQGVARLGNQRLKAFLADVATRRLSVSRDRHIGTATQNIWEHCVAVALLARDISALSGNGDPEEAYLCGLVHDIGKVVLAAVLLEAERMLARSGRGTWIESSTWLDVVLSAHRVVGAALAERWNFPEEIARSVRDSAEYDSGDRTAAMNTVCLANALSKQSDFYTGPVDVDDVNALILIGRSLIGIEEDVVKSVMKGIRERVAKLWD